MPRSHLYDHVYNRSQFFTHMHYTYEYAHTGSLGAKGWHFSAHSVADATINNYYKLGWGGFNTA